MKTLEQARRIADELAVLAKAEYDADDARPDSVSAKLQRARCATEDAITELMAKGAKKYNREIIPGTVEILRERRPIPRREVVTA